MLGVVVGDPGDALVGVNVVGGVNGVVGATAVCSAGVAEHLNSLGVGVPGPDESVVDVLLVDFGRTRNLLNQDYVWVGKQLLDGRDVSWWDVLCRVDSEAGNTQRDLVVEELGNLLTNVWRFGR